MFLETLSVSLLAAPLAAEAQSAGKAWRVGFVGAETLSTNRHFLDAFRLGMREQGYVEGQTLSIEDRWAEGKNERFRDLTAELIRLPVDVIVTFSTSGALAAKDLTRSVPIIFIAVDPVGSGIVSNLARPGGNVTGLSINLGDEFATKWLQLLGEVVPRLSRVAIVWNPTNRSHASFLKAMQASTRPAGTKLLPQGVSNPDQLESAFQVMATGKAQALIALPDPLTVRYRARIVELAAKYRLPAIYGFREFADAGRLMAYGSNLPALSKRAAVYVDKIFRGAKPGDLPVEQATQFEFVINLKTAKALGLTIPQSLLIRADTIIE